MTRHYLDHASSSPLRPEAAAAMSAWLTPGAVGDPGRIHTEGMTARVALEEARDAVAALVGARNREVVFTSSGTEAIATAVWGAAERGRHLVVGATEHSAVRLAAAALAETGTHELTVLNVDPTGRVDPDAVVGSLRPDTALVAVQWSNHEVGTRQPVEVIARRLADHPALLLVDAAQGAGRDDIDFIDSGIDLLTVSGHKFGGPTGTGVLCVRRGLRLRPLLVGSDQERARRAGMENVAAIAGLGAVANVLSDPAERGAEADRQRALSASLSAVLAAVEGVHLLGDPERRAPHIVCAIIDGVEPQAVLLDLDRAGIAAHSGSACASGDLAPSPVLAAMGVDAHHSLRLSVGWTSTDADVTAFSDVFGPTIARLRQLSSHDPGRIPTVANVPTGTEDPDA